MLARLVRPFPGHPPRCPYPHRWPQAIAVRSLAASRLCRRHVDCPNKPRLSPYANSGLSQQDRAGITTRTTSLWSSCRSSARVPRRSRANAWQATSSRPSPGKRVLCMKSELHLSQDGPKMPIAKLWAQIIAEAQPKLIITTGTAGGIGAKVVLGDVLSAKSVRFDCLKSFKSQPFHNRQIYRSHARDRTRTSRPRIGRIETRSLVNTAHVPASNRVPQIATKSAIGHAGIPYLVTSDFFAFDDSANDYGHRASVAPPRWAMPCIAWSSTR